MKAAVMRALHAPLVVEGIEAATPRPHLYLNGQLLLDEMISARLPLEGVNDALEALRQGTAARSVLMFG